MATPDHNNHADIPMRSLTTDSKTHATTHTRTQPLVAEHRGGTHYVRNDRSRTRRTQEVPFIAGCIHITRPTHPCSHYNVICIHTLQNTKRDAAAPAAHKTHYTETHKIWCSGFLPKTKPMQQSCRHYNAFCSITWQTCMYLRTWQQNMTRIRQPLQCDLQSEIKEAHKSTHT